MTNVLSLNSSGELVEVAHTSASSVLACASDGSIIEIAASGTQKVLSLAADGGLQEVSVAFGGSTSTTIIPTPYWTF